jgi:hypothetical protein
VVRAKYYNKVPQATRWYTPSTTLLTTVRLQQVLVDNPEIHPELATCKLPNTCNKVAARSKGVQMINVNDHKKIVDEITCCGILDFFVEEEEDDNKELDANNEEEEDDKDGKEEEEEDDEEDNFNSTYIRQKIQKHPIAQTTNTITPITSARNY